MSVAVRVWVAGLAVAAATTVAAWDWWELMWAWGMEQ